MTNCIEDPDSVAGWTRYNHGCRCAPCVRAVRDYQKAYLRKARAEAALLRATLPPGTPLPFCNGTQGTYTMGCRCAPCTAASRDYHRKRRASAIEGAKALRETLPPGTPLPFCNGTKGAYSLGCRCDRCRAAASRSQAAHRARKKESEQ